MPNILVGNDWVAMDADEAYCEMDEGTIRCSECGDKATRLAPLDDTFSDFWPLCQNCEWRITCEGRASAAHGTDR